MNFIFKKTNKISNNFFKKIIENPIFRLQRVTDSQKSHREKKNIAVEEKKKN